MSMNMQTAATSVHRFDDIEQSMTAASSRHHLLAQADFARMLGDKLDAMLEGEARVLSLDIFDTLLLRDKSSELTRFFQIGERLAEIVNDKARPAARSKVKAAPITGVDALLARHFGTRASYRASRPVKGCREGSLSEIHAAASRMLTGNDKLAAAFIEAELAYEATRMKPNRLLIDYVKRHRARGGRVTLVTDMYMHKPQVEVLLKALGVERSLFDLIMSSADTKVSKASGGIFELVEQALEATPAQFVHVGDSLRGDFQKPRQRGWAAVHLPIPEAEIVARRKDHLSTASMLASKHGIAVDIAMPH